MLITFCKSSHNFHSMGTCLSLFFQRLLFNIFFGRGVLGNLIFVG